MVLMVFMIADYIFYLYAVMLMGTLVYGIRYTLPEYICTFLVAGGVSSFALMKVRNNWWREIVVLFSFLACMTYFKHIGMHLCPFC